MALFPSGSADHGSLPQFSASSLTFLTFTHAHKAPLILAHQQRRACVNSFSTQSAVVKRTFSLALTLFHLSPCGLAPQIHNE